MKIFLLLNTSRQLSFSSISPIQKKFNNKIKKKKTTQNFLNYHCTERHNDNQKWQDAFILHENIEKYWKFYVNCIRTSKFNKKSERF